jgi:catechol 2,3-dioxygenase-like lactoylglutathione lyase family enzyme
MDPGFDHLTVVVEDLDDAKEFFGLLDFVEKAAVVVSGEEMAGYMGIPGWEADHVTLVLAGAQVHQEVQLLRFHSPAANVDNGAATLDRTGFNHVCFRVENLESTLAKMRAAGVHQRSEIMEFHDRKLVFLDGPGLVVELAEWLTEEPGAG